MAERPLEPKTLAPPLLGGERVLLRPIRSGPCRGECTEAWATGLAHGSYEAHLTGLRACP
jgi:hypothetical protein